MKYNNFLLALALCAGLQFNISLSSETQPEQSSWRYIPQFMQDIASTASNYIQSIKDRVSSWSTRKKVAVASAILASLAAVYNREAIMALFNNAMQSTEEPQAVSAFAGTPEELAAMQKGQDNWDFENRVDKVKSLLGTNRNTGVVPISPKELMEIYRNLNPNADKDPAFNEAVKQLRDKGLDFSSYKHDLYDLTQ